MKNLVQLAPVEFERIRENAIVLNRARASYESAWRKYMIAAEADPMDESRFWEIVVDYRNLVLYAKKINRVDTAKWAAEEFVRRALVGQYDSNMEFDEAVHFALNWRIYVRKFYTAADKSQEIKWGLSDDGFGDLMDGLVLCGKSFLTKLENDEFEGRKHFRREATEILGDLADMVLNGENYFATSLEDAAQKWFLSFARNLVANVEDVA